MRAREAQKPGFVIADQAQRRVLLLLHAFANVVAEDPVERSPRLPRLERGAVVHRGGDDQLNHQHHEPRR